MITLTHAKVSNVPDSSNGDLIQPSDWNEEHVIGLSSGTIVGRSTAGDGEAEEITVGAGLSLADGALTLNRATATVDFGATPIAEGSVTVTNAAITASSYVQAFVMVDSTADNDAGDHRHAAASWKLVCEPGSGSFTLYVTALMDLFWGTFKIRYVWA